MLRHMVLVIQKVYKNTYGFLDFLKCDVRNLEYFVRRVQKMLRHMASVIQKVCKNLWCSCFFEIVIFKSNEKPNGILRFCFWLFKNHVKTYRFL